MMNALIAFMTAIPGKAPKYIVIILVVLGLVFGSHAGLDYLVASIGDTCIPLDVDTNVCLVSE